MTTRSPKPRPKAPPPVKLLPALKPVSMPMVASAVLNGTAIDATLRNAVMTMERERTMLRASQITLSIADPNGEVLRSPILDQRIELKLPDAGTWIYDRGRSIGGYGYQGGVLTIRFWDLESAAMKSVNHARRWDGKRYDLEAFVRAVATETMREVKGVTLRAVVPRPDEILTPVTPVVQRTVRSASGDSKAVGRMTPGRGFPAGAAGKLTVKGARATPAQVRVLDAVITEADSLNASPRVQAAALMAVIQESQAGALLATTGDDDAGYFQQGRPWISLANTRDPAKGCRAFLLGGSEAKVGGTGGTSGWKQTHGSLRQATGDLGLMVAAVQRPRADLRGEYSRWYVESMRAVELWHGGSGTKKIARSAATSSASTAEKTEMLKRLHRPTEWRRGKTGSPESTYTMLDRYAQSFGRRRFVTEDRLVVADDEDLIRAAPHQTLTISDPNIVERPSLEQDGPGGLESLDFSILAAAWRTPPGGVIDLQGAGSAASGPWLVATLTDTAGSPVVRVQLTQPATEDPDKQTRTIRTTTVGDGSAAGASSRTAKADSSASGRVYQAALQISQATPGYEYGGGHRGERLTSALMRKRLDCSSSSSLALKLGGLFRADLAITSGIFASSWGIDGEGERITVWANAGHVFLEFKGLGKYRRLDTSAFPGQGPKVATTMRSTSGFTPRHWPGT
jgi:hypothetical protein